MTPYVPQKKDEKHARCQIPRAGYKIVISLLVTVPLVFESTSNDVTSNDLVWYIYFQSNALKNAIRKKMRL